MSGVMNHANIVLSIDSVALKQQTLADADDSLVYKLSRLFSNGTSTGQASRHYHGRRTLAASANEDLDLAGGLTDFSGATITATKLKALLIVASEGNTNDVRLTRPASNGAPLFMAAGDGIALAPGEAFLFVGKTGKTVTADTGDLLNVANSAGGTGVSYDIYALFAD
jgi:hypothetical protein